MQSSRWDSSSLWRCGASAPARCSLPQRCQGPSPDQHVVPHIHKLVTHPRNRHRASPRERCGAPDENISTGRPPHSQTASPANPTRGQHSDYALTIRVRVSSSAQACGPITHQLPPEAPMKQALISAACIIALNTLGACSSTTESSASNTPHQQVG